MPGAAWDTFVGRVRAELDVLDAALRRAEAGDGAFVLVGGEPGIGKSSLIDRFAVDARKRGARVVWGRCWEAGGAPAYWPWVQAIRTIVRDNDSATVRALATVGAADLAQIIPDLRDALPELGDPTETDPDAARFRLFDAVAAFLRESAARETALVIALDDVHAADTPSLLLLQFLAPEVRAARIVLVIGYRSTELTREHPLTSTLAELTRVPNARRVTLEGFAPGEISEYIATITGGDIDAAVVAAVEARTDGNPLFVSEIIRMMIPDPSSLRAPVRLPDEIPEGVQEAITRRVGALSSPCRATLDAAAILGRDIPLDVLQALTEAGPDDLFDALDEATASGMLVRTGGATGDLRFSHVLVRDALYERLPSAWRARLHLRAGELTEALRAHDPDRHLSEIAHHYIAAGPVVDPAIVARHAAIAGQDAVHRLAYEEAIRLLRAAVELVERTNALDDTRLDLLLELGDAEARAGDLAAAQETFHVAADLARVRRHPDALARAAIGYGGRFAWCRAGDDTALIGLLEDALGAVGSDDSVLRVRLLSRLAGARRSELGSSRRRAEAAEALAIARRLGDPRALASALGGYHGAIWDADTPEERLRLAEEMIANAVRAGDTEELVISYCAHWIALWELGDFVGARNDIEVAVPLAGRLQQPAQRWLVAIGQAAIGLFEGRFDEVEHFALAGRKEGQGSLQFDADSAYLTQIALLRLEQGRAGEMLVELERGANAYSWYPQLRALLARLYAADGQLDRARGEVEILAASGFARVFVAANYTTFTFSILADVACELGDATLAKRLYEQLAPYAERNAMAPPEASVGWIGRPLGVLCGILGAVDAGSRFFEHAIRAHDEMGARPWLARTHHDFARLLRDIDPARAEEHARQALAIAETLGMTLLTTVIGHPPPLGGAYVFRREGEYWTIAFEERAIRLRNSKGLLYLAALLGQPGREVPAVELAALGDRSVPRDSSDGGELLDARARGEYRRRIEELQAEIDEAEGWADGERAARAREELDMLARELSAATGLGGRDRGFGSAAERARQRVKKAIASALARIDAAHPPLGRHLAGTVRTGYGCRYEPDSRAPITWQL